MGYIKLKKADGSVDLLPAENIVHVSAPSSSNKDIGITYDVNDRDWETIIKLL